MDAPSSGSGDVVRAASSGFHKMVRKKDMRAASKRMRLRVGHEEMATHWSIEEDDDDME
jgi:hypothetical protein